MYIYFLFLWSLFFFHCRILSLSIYLLNAIIILVITVFHFYYCYWKLQNSCTGDSNICWWHLLGFRSSSYVLTKRVESISHKHLVYCCHLGDNIFGPSTSDAAESLIGAFRPAIESRIPWAAILGNHDQESTMTREELMSFISLMDYSVAQINPFVSYLSKAKEKYEHIDGFGNYDIQVNGALGSELANTSILDLYFLDSGDRETVGGIRTYGWIKESQLHWLRSISEGFQVWWDFILLLLL